MKKVLAVAALLASAGVATAATTTTSVVSSSVPGIVSITGATNFVTNSTTPIVDTTSALVATTANFPAANPAGLVFFSNIATAKVKVTSVNGALLKNTTVPTAPIGFVNQVSYGTVTLNGLVGNNGTSATAFSLEPISSGTPTITKTLGYIASAPVTSLTLGSLTAAGGSPLVAGDYTDTLNIEITAS